MFNSSNEVFNFLEFEDYRKEKCIKNRKRFFWCLYLHKNAKKCLFEAKEWPKIVYYYYCYFYLPMEEILII